MSNLKATRMQLLIIKRKIKLAKKGHKLLKEKRDALIMEFFSILKEIKELRKGIGTKLKQALRVLGKAQALQGITDVERFALGVSPDLKVEFGSKAIMGLEMPSISEVESKHQWHGFIESSIELDNAMVKFREILPALLKLSAKQLAFQRLGEEIKKTKRRVNSLEYIIIPRLDGASSMIEFKLEELERENFTRLKMIKAKATA
ncbi:MAG: V-type ATP synthase subunit D [archaeon]|jgi:V/A-type H+-transporting ATPase subunit D|nr:V-type ATP synthase subunit D [archaeon]